MKKYIHLMLAVACMSALSACSSYNYYTAAQNKTNLSAYRTFALAGPTTSRNKQWRPLDEIGNGKIQKATEQALTSKGLVMAQQNPDLLVHYATVTGRGSKMEFYTPYYGGFYGGWGWGGGWYRPWGWGFGYGGWGGPWGGYGPTYAQKVHYKEGTIIIDLVDSKTQRIVWRGYGVGELRNPKQTMNDIPKIVEGIIKQLDLAPPLTRS
ncbi:DUF4136 domain-containing protein [Mucilaginibacter phyllosphaerae]|uniref:DUF4136 domain-containing protein n=1 Tax=Mucilaginibacter phyllosphaerae TaxID=1812349 RepID=A0A4Y8AIE7_9SPHI|nr:DUF4136 domain-containing protein [Mucilaginibacter phyllosphaerae]MBB3968453.1 hypothetical protein [Mucilaginibacter phyllosphaerae]TEW67899.1 DUF4136 domain-containing protein [Mucilaginibacter phyllosphaerae]GGH15903.1 hypothetical protein GCM10007352_24970 [Mucilaginibacter phyllosphaerae]